MWPDTEMCALYTSRLKIKTSYSVLEDILWKSEAQPVEEMVLWNSGHTVHTKFPATGLNYLSHRFHTTILAKITLLCLPLQTFDT